MAAMHTRNYNIYEQLMNGGHIKLQNKTGFIALKTDYN